MYLFFIYFFISSLLVYFFIDKYIYLANKKKIIDNQNPNYSNKPTPTGAGIIFVFIFLLGNLFFYYFDNNFNNLIPNRYYIFLASLSIIVLVCFRDDIKPLDPLLRLILQIILIYLSITALDLKTLSLPTKISFLFAVIVWIYLMNIINFIDGSDGFLITNMFFFWILILILSIFFNIELFSKYLAIILIPIIFIFAYYNKPVASAYMGDAGSIFFGFLTGFCFLELVTIGHWSIAIGLLIYPILDCSICLTKKLFKGHMPWVGLYDYFFLIPVLRNKFNHRNILFIIFIFHILNSFAVYLQLYYNNILFLSLSIILAMIVIFIFKNIKLETLKIFK